VLPLPRGAGQRWRRAPRPAAPSARPSLEAGRLHGPCLHALDYPRCADHLNTSSDLRLRFRPARDAVRGGFPQPNGAFIHFPRVLFLPHPPTHPLLLHLPLITPSVRRFPSFSPRDSLPPRGRATHPHGCTPPPPPSPPGAVKAARFPRHPTTDSLPRLARPPSVSSAPRRSHPPKRIRSHPLAYSPHTPRSSAPTPIRTPLAPHRLPPFHSPNQWQWRPKP
jgi:hypothetical protein